MNILWFLLFSNFILGKGTCKREKDVNPITTTGASRPTIGVLRPTTGALRPTTGASRPTTGALRPTTGALRPTTGALRLTSEDPNPATFTSPRLTTRVERLNILKDDYVADLGLSTGSSESEDTDVDFDPAEENRRRKRKNVKKTRRNPKLKAKGKSKRKGKTLEDEFQEFPSILERADNTEIEAVKDRSEMKAVSGSEMTGKVVIVVSDSEELNAGEEIGKEVNSEEKAYSEENDLGEARSHEMDFGDDPKQIDIIPVDSEEMYSDKGEKTSYEEEHLEERDLDSNIADSVEVNSEERHDCEYIESGKDYLKEIESMGKDSKGVDSIEADSSNAYLEEAKLGESDYKEVGEGDHDSKYVELEETTSLATECDVEVQKGDFENVVPGETTSLAVECDVEVQEGDFKSVVPGETTSLAAECDIKVQEGDFENVVPGETTSLAVECDVEVQEGDFKNVVPGETTSLAAECDVKVQEGDFENVVPGETTSLAAECDVELQEGDFENVGPTHKRRLKWKRRHSLPTYCVECKIDFTTGKAYQNHGMLTHPNKKIFPCRFPKCKSSFMKISSLNSHEVRVHGRKETNSKTNPTMQEIFLPHEKICREFDENSFKNLSCTKCGEHFLNEERLRMHFETDHKNDHGNYPCRRSRCQEIFFNAKGRDGHEKYDHEPIPWKEADGAVPLPKYCDNCDIPFDTVMSYEKHNVSQHPKKRIFPCSVSECFASFTRVSSLFNHQIEAHGRPEFVMSPRQDSKELVCRECGEIAYSSTYLSRHFEENHPQSKPFTCDVNCGASFTQMKNLQRHNNSHHGPDCRYKCDTCRCPFRKWSHVLEHKKRCDIQRDSTSLVEMNAENETE